LRQIITHLIRLILVIKAKMSLNLTYNHIGWRYLPGNDFLASRNHWDIPALHTNPISTLFREKKVVVFMRFLILVKILIKMYISPPKDLYFMCNGVIR